jgi:hypothetical protein
MNQDNTVRNLTIIGGVVFCIVDYHQRCGWSSLQCMGTIVAG